MDSLIDFIKNFHPSDFGLGLWEILMIIVLAIAALILISWIVSFLPSRIGDSIKTIVRRTFSIISYILIVLIVLIVLIILNAILTGEYGNVLIIGLLIVASKVDYFYKLYDNFVDKRVNKEGEKNIPCLYSPASIKIYDPKAIFPFITNQRL